jgi:hypothetical protein
VVVLVFLSFFFLMVMLLVFFMLFVLLVLFVLVFMVMLEDKNLSGKSYLRYLR